MGRLGKILLLLASLAGTAAFGQVVEDTEDHVIVSGLDPVPEVRVRVLDGASSAPLSGATVSLYVPGDTVRMAADRNGTARFRHNFRKDSITLAVSYVGYENLTHKHRITRNQTRLTVRMSVDSVNINAILVRGKRIAMVIRGDTTFYNASAFKTMRGDPLKYLLRKLPGLEFRDGALYAGGERISMILVNGTMLFGRNTQAAMEMLRSDEVVHVKVYDQYAQDRLIAADTLDGKERVVDIATKEPVHRAREGRIGALAGYFPDRNEAADRDLFGSGYAGYRRFTLEKPNIDAWLGGGKNAETSAPSTQPSANAAAQFSIEKQTSGNKYRHSIDFQHQTRQDAFGQQDVYEPSQSYASRIADLAKESENRNLKASYAGVLGYRVGRRGTLSFNLMASYDRLRDDRSDRQHTLTDGMVSATDLSQRVARNGYGLGVSALYSYRFKKPGRMLTLSAQWNRSDRNGDGWRVDTLASSTARQWLTDTSDHVSDKVGFVVSYGEPFGRLLRMNLRYSAWASSSVAQKFAVDELAGWTDTTNTFRYTQRDFEQRVQAGLQLRNMSKTLTAQAGAVYNLSDRLRRERFPEGYRQPNTFHVVSPRLSIEYIRPAFRLHVDYEEQPQTLSVEDLRGVIDDASPYFLRAGNPALRQPLQRKISCRIDLTSVVSASSWNFEANYTICSDYLTSRILYYDRKEYLPQYDYTVLPGASLTLPVNTDGFRLAEARIGYTKNSGVLQSTLKAQAEYRYDRTPYFMGEEPYDNDRHGLDLVLGLETGFSQHVEVSLTARTGLGRSTRDGALVYESVREDLTGSLRVNFLKRLWFQGRLTYLFQNTTRPSTRNEHLILNASVACRFGKEDAGEISLGCHDLLNRTSAYTHSLLDDHVRSTWQRIFGRSLSVSISYRFR